MVLARLSRSVLSIHRLTLPLTCTRALRCIPVHRSCSSLSGSTEAADTATVTKLESTLPSKQSPAEAITKPVEGNVVAIHYSTLLDEIDRICESTWWEGRATEFTIGDG